MSIAMNEVCVRVAVRIRPLLHKEVLHNHQVCVRVVPGTGQVMLGSDRLFPFDHAFGPTATQDEVYESGVQPLVESLIEGFNATVFAYGQTGSGKTYTLGGGHVAYLPEEEEEEEEGGIIERVAQDVFLRLGEKRQRSGGVEATLRVSYIELYREELRDLLERHTYHKELHIRDDDRGNTVVVGATEMVVTSAEELLSILETGNALRHTGTTGMNEHSSRSHAILTLHLIQHCHDNSSSLNLVRLSKLHLVDLAGSERAGKTGNTGTQLKESSYINTGLLALGNVIRALSDPGRNRRGNNSNTAHIPYRDAKITRLLRDSLGGTAHTLMVVCVSPSHQSVAETLSVLQFAARARHVHNRPRTVCSRAEVKSCPTTWDPGEARLGELEYEVQALRELLKEKEIEIERGKEKAGGEEDNFKQANQIRISDGISDSDRKVNQEELPQYRLLAQEAASLLENVSSPTLSPSVRQQLEDWQERLKAVNSSHQTDDEGALQVDGDQPHHVTILQLRRELNKCQETLAIEEQMLEQKQEELRQVHKDVQKLLQENETYLQALQEERERTRIQTEHLVDQQIQIDRLRGDLMTFRGATSAASLEAVASRNSARRPHSVPLTRHSCGQGPARKIHTSPPAYSLERVLAAFKMRGHLLLAEVEEKDQVYCPSIKQVRSKDGNEEEDNDSEDRMGFSRSLNRTWTSRQKKTALKPNSAGPDQNTKNTTQLHQQAQTATGAKESHAKQPSLRKARLRASFIQRWIQELSINMRMKEELIKELDKTDKETQAVDRHGRHSGNSLLARLSLQSQQARAELHYSLQHMRLQRIQLQSSLRQERDTSDTAEGQNVLKAEDLTVWKSKLHNESKEKEHSSVWLEEEEDQALWRRAELQELEEELRRREEVLQRREACLQQRNKLEVKRLRSSQALGQDLLRVSVRLESLEEQLEGNSRAGQTGGVTTEELQKERDALRKRRDTLDAQHQQGRVLTAQEEHSLLQLEEAIEALDAALEFKNRSIQDKQKQLSMTASSSSSSSSCLSHSTEPTHLCNVTRKLKELSPLEASELLVKYFNKVVCLREAERRLRLYCEELQLQAGEQGVVVKEREAAFQRLALDTDRRLTQQHRDHLTSIQLLLQQRKETGSGETEQAVQARLQELEKDLLFYKSSSRQLKKKVKELQSLLHSSQQPAAQPSHTQTHNQQIFTKANNRKMSTDQMQTKTNTEKTYTRIHTEQIHTMTHNDQAKTSQVQTHTERLPPQDSSPSSSSDLQTHRKIKIPAYTQIHRHTQSQGRNGGGVGHNGEGLAMTPICLSRRVLRQISPVELQESGSATGTCQSVVATSTEPILEDSIEVPRNTNR